MNKYALRALACCLALGVLAGCSTDQIVRQPASDHHHTPQENWQRNGTHHWQLCQCGEVVNTALHALDETDTCCQCGSHIWDRGDDIEVSTFDSEGNPLLVSTYTTSGELIWETRYQREYNDRNILLRVLCFENESLIQEDIYTYCSDQSDKLSFITSRYQDGSSSLYRYDAAGNMTLVQEIAPDGTVRFESICAYTADEEGHSYLSQCKDHMADGSTFLARYNQYQDIIFRELLEADGTAIYRESFEYGYNADGQRLWAKEYDNGRLVREIPSYIGSDGGVPQQIIDYFEVGGWLVSDYAENTELIRETWYNADGSLFLVLNYTYEYDDAGYYISTSVYEFDRLMTHTQYTTTSDGLNYPHTETFYDENGTTRVYRYNQEGDLISQIEG